MTIRKAKPKDIAQIKKLVDTIEEIDTTQETFSEDYYKRVNRKGILLVAEEKNVIVGVCFGTYNKKEKWADLLGLAVKPSFRSKGLGTSLIKEFEKIVRSKKLKTIDLYSDKKQLRLFKKLKYKQGRNYIALRKKL